MMNSVMNQLTLNNFDFSTLSREQLEGLFKNFISARLVITDCQGNDTTFEVTEMFNRKTTLCDEDGYEIHKETVAY